MTSAPESTPAMPAACGRLNRYARIAIGAGNILPATLLIYLVRRYAADVPRWDEWHGFVEQALEPIDRGTLGLSGLMAQHFEHRILFPRLITLANAAWFHWDRRVEMFITLALLMFAAAVLYGFAQRYWNSRWAPLCFLPMAWTLMSWRQSENLLWGFQTQVALLVAGTVMAFCLLAKARGAGKAIWLAAASAFVATFSFASGLAVWPIGLMQLILQQAFGTPDERPGRTALAVWSAAGVLSWGLYFIGYQSPAEAWPRGWGYLVQHPTAAVDYTLIALGSPLSANTETARSLGLAFAVLGAYALIALSRLPRRRWAAAGPWLSLMAFTVLMLGALCLGRLSVDQPWASRYCSIGMLGIAAVYTLLVEVSLSGRRPADLLACGGMAALMITAQGAAFPAWQKDYEARYAEIVRTAKYALWNADVVGDAAFWAAGPDPQYIRRHIAFARAHRYSLFREPSPMGLPSRDAGPSTACAIDTINGSTQNPMEVHLSNQSGLKAAALKIQGWAVDPSVGQLPDRVLLSIDGIDIPAVLGGPRPDVAAALHNDRYLDSTVISYPRLSLLPPGEHTLSWKIVSHDGSAYSTCLGGAAPRVIRVVK